MLRRYKAYLGRYIKVVKLTTNIKEITFIEDASVGGLVRSTIDKNATGMIVQVLSKEEDVLSQLVLKS